MTFVSNNKGQQKRCPSACRKTFSASCETSRKVTRCRVLCPEAVQRYRERAKTRQTHNIKSDKNENQEDSLKILLIFSCLFFGMVKTIPYIFVRVLGDFIDSLKDFEKGDEMPCSLPRSCTKVPREGKNTANAQNKSI